MVPILVARTLETKIKGEMSVEMVRAILVCISLWSRDSWAKNECRTAKDEPGNYSSEEDSRSDDNQAHE